MDVDRSADAWDTLWAIPDSVVVDPLPVPAKAAVIRRVAPKRTDNQSSMQRPAVVAAPAGTEACHLSASALEIGNGSTGPSSSAEYGVVPTTSFACGASTGPVTGEGVIAADSSSLRAASSGDRDPRLAAEPSPVPPAVAGAAPACASAAGSPVQFGAKAAGPAAPLRPLPPLPPLRRAAKTTTALLLNRVRRDPGSAACSPQAATRTAVAAAARAGGKAGGKGKRGKAAQSSIEDWIASSRPEAATGPEPRHCGHRSARGRFRRRVGASISVSASAAPAHRRPVRKTPEALLRRSLLEELAARCPTSVLDLEEVPGLPRPWIRNYGQEVLDVCRNFLHVHAVLSVRSSDGSTRWVDERAERLRRQLLGAMGLQADKPIEPQLGVTMNVTPETVAHLQQQNAASSQQEPQQTQPSAAGAAPTAAATETRAAAAGAGSSSEAPARPRAALARGGGGWVPAPAGTRIRAGAALAYAPSPAVHYVRVTDLLGLLAEAGRMAEPFLEDAGSVDDKEEMAAAGAAARAQPPVAASAAKAGAGRRPAGSGVSSDVLSGVAGMGVVPAPALAAAAAVQGLGRVSGQEHMRQLRAMVAAAMPAWEVRRVLACKALGASAQAAAVLRVTHATPRAEVRMAFRRLSLAVHPDKNKSDSAAEAFAMVSAAASRLLGSVQC
eukprot:XP_001702588.1 predicted protein [Chlamydomonas reinhardtii]